MIGIDPENTYERFEFDQAVAGLGRYVDNKLEEFDDKTFKPVYPNLQSLLNTVKGNKVNKEPTKKKLTAPPPRFRRRRKKNK